MDVAEALEAVVQAVADIPVQVESASSQGQITQMVNADLQLDLKYTLYAGAPLNSSPAVPPNYIQFLPPAHAARY